MRGAVATCVEDGQGVAGEFPKSCAHNRSFWISLTLRPTTYYTFSHVHFHIHSGP